MVVTGETKNFSGRKSLTVSNTTIQYGGTATFTSARVVNLQSGFEAKAGSRVDVFIENIPPCDDLLFSTSKDNILQPIKSGYINTTKKFEISFETNILENHISIFPNPTNSTITVQLHSDNPEAELNCIKLYDIFGRTILSKQVIGLSHVLNISTCPPGIYFIEIKDENKSYHQKLIIN